VKTFFVVVSALVFLVVCAAQAYRAYTGIPVLIAGHEVPIMCSWATAGITGFLALGLLIFGRK
jgi:hypothetical protein